MKVLVACEYSGIVRDAFIARGHSATSCNLLDTETVGPHHKGDVRDLLNNEWDLLIGHPPCTYLSRAGGWLMFQRHASKTDAPVGSTRFNLMMQAIRFFNMLRRASIPCIAIENPPMHRYAMQHIERPHQIVHPWMFGNPLNKPIGLWLKNLPKLYATQCLPKRQRETWVVNQPPHQDRSKIRSRFFPEVAQAMAVQWGG